MAVVVNRQEPMCYMGLKLGELGKRGGENTGTDQKRAITKVNCSISAGKVRSYPLYR